MSVTFLSRSKAARLAAFVVCSAVILCASSTMAQERYGKGPYDEGRAPYAAEDSYGHDDREPSEYQRPHEQQHDSYSKDHYGEAVEGVCLRTFDEKNYQIDGLNTYEIKLRCCEPQELPQACLHNDTYAYEPHKDWKRGDSGFFQDTALNPEYAAKCTLTELPAVPCSSALATGPTECLTVDLSCVLNKHAAKCGCPFEDGVSLTARLYAQFISAKTCFSSPGMRKQQQPSSNTFKKLVSMGAFKTALETGAKHTHMDAPGGVLYNVIATRAQGAISFVDTPYGAVERKATVEYFPNIVRYGTGTPVASYSQDVADPGLINKPLMWIRFASEDPKY